MATTATSMATGRPGSSLAPVAPATSAQIYQATTQAPSFDDIFLPDDKVDMRLLMIALWQNRRDQVFTRELCTRLTHLAKLSGQTMDQVEFYLPQLAHMVIHLEQELPIEDMEQFVLLLSQTSVHFALQLFWIIYAALDENRPKRAGGSQRTFARCAQLLLALEQCLVYGSPMAKELSELFTRNSISKEEMERILLADRRFFAAQQHSSAESSLEVSVSAIMEGWLHKKGGGTSTMGRRNWKLRWCRIDKRVLLVYTKPGDETPRTAVPLDRAEVRIVENPKHPFYFELIHDYSETKMKFAAQSQDELLTWIQSIHRAAAVPEPPGSSTSKPNSESPRRTLARMSLAMRSFILQTTSSSSAGPNASQSSSPVKGAISKALTPPASPRAHSESSTSRTPFGTNDAWSESKRQRTRTVSSVSSASAHSSEASDVSSILTETIIQKSQPSLPFDQQRRYEFFTGMITFVKAITDVSESLRRIEPTKRKALLRPRLEHLHVPTNAYIPLCRSTDVYCRVRSVFTNEGRVFSTNERAPCLLYFDTEEDEKGKNVSQALFDHLYAEAEDKVNDGDANHLDVGIPISNLDGDAFLGTGAAVTVHRISRGVEPFAYGQSKFLGQLLEDPERKLWIEKVFGELSVSTVERLQSSTLCQDTSRWRMCSLIAKSHDDLRQEVLVMQLITYFQHIFRLEELPLRLHPYRILSTGASTGLLEVVRNAMSLDGIKKTPGFKNLRHHFEQLYGGEDGSEYLHQAELNFIHSLAAYSLVCYILSIKDRHNGNIMLDVEGHIIHIDFGFFLGRAPGGSFSFETAPFKLTAEMVDVLGGRNSSKFKYYCDLCVKGGIAIRKHADTVYTLVEVMSFHSKLPCFVGNTSAALAGLRERLFLTTPEDKIEATILQMIERSYDHFGTNKYDQFQVYSNGIAK